MKSKVLLTGATGFLGSNILKKLVHTHDVSIIVRNVSRYDRIKDHLPDIKKYNTDELTIEHIVADAQPDIIIHCATDYGRKNISPLKVIEANLVLPLNLLYYANNNGVSMFINTDTYLDKRINHYSLSKKQFREWFENYSKEMICVNMILEHFYGPYDDKTKFVSFVIQKLLKEEQELELTPGEQKRNFIFIDDVVGAFETVIKHDFQNQNGFYDFFVGSDDTIAIKDFVTLLKKLSKNQHTHLNFGAIPYRANEVMNSDINTTALKQLGWKVQTSLEDGLLTTIEAERNMLS